MRRALTVLFLIVVGTAGWVAASLFLPYGEFPAEGVYVDIPRGASTRMISRILFEQGVIRSRWVFEGLSRERHHALQAGEYFFDRPVTSLGVYEMLASGRVFVRELLVPEGYSMFDIADLVEKEGFTTREDFLAAAGDPASIRDIAPDVPSLEGFLFPATYEFGRHASGEEITTAMVKRFRQTWADMEAQAGGGHQGQDAANLERVVTLASLVERETPKAEERPEVAGVFTKRLEMGVPLQCDPTVVYALELAGNYSGRLEAGNLRIASPFNTYLHRGLPPGPIANPGEAALRGAFDPPQTDYLYFVADTEGGHLFSKTLAEHNRNVARYRQRIAQELRAAAAQRGGAAGATPPAAQRHTP